MKSIFLAAFLIFAVFFLEAPVARGQVTNSATTNAVTAVARKNDMAAFFQMHWQDRVRAFDEQNLAWRNVVLLGDSITEGFDVAKYFPGRRVINRGIGADVIGNGLPSDDHRGVLRRLDSSVFNCSATDVFLLIGINDLGDGHSLDTMEQGYRDLLQRIRTRLPAVHIHVQSVLPTRGSFAHHNANIRDFNERLRKMAVEFDCDYIDLHRLMIDDLGELKSEYTREGLHLTDPAYVAWRTEINRVMGWN